MSELIAEARVLVTPDTTTFRSLLVAQTTAAAKGVVVPVQVTPVVSGTGNASALAAQSTAIAVAEKNAAEQIRGATDAKRAAVPATTAYTKSLKQMGTGAGSAAASLLGVRGATLAATAPFIAGAAGAITLGRALGIATSFNSEIAVLGAVTDATGSQLERAAQAARQFGADISLPGVTASDAAQTITAFSKAGLDLEDSIAATRGGLQLAQAAQLSYTDAVELSAGALNAFNLEGNQAVHVADVLANAANLAQGGITDTALALRQAAAAAEVVGVSFEDTAALLTLLARNGLTGSDAGTALRTSFLRLVNPSKEAAGVLRSLNVQLRDAQGNVRPEIFAEFAEAQSDLSVATQQANAAIVFGQDAFRAFGILGQEGAAGLAEVQEGLEKTGTAAELARARMTGLAGATENLSNQLSTLALGVGQAVTPFVTGLVRGLGFAVQGVNILTESIRDLGGERFDIDTAQLKELEERLQEINKEADHFRESGGFTPVRLSNESAEIVKEIEEIGKALLATPAGLGGFVDFPADQEGAP
jgi:TP901 family phage tail tape measure protein